MLFIVIVILMLVIGFGAAAYLAWKRQKSFFTTAIIDATAQFDLKVVLEANDKDRRRHRYVSNNDYYIEKFERSDTFLLIVQPWIQGSLNYADLAQIKSSNIKLLSNYGVQRRNLG